MVSGAQEHSACDAECVVAEGGDSSENQRLQTKCIARKHGAVLSKQDAMEIFKMKQHLGSEHLTAPSIALARKYNVSSKTIRDIWNGRSWVEATLHPEKASLLAYTTSIV